MYESRDFSTIRPLLADALQDAGCDNEDIPDHCRNPGPHVRGCWVVELVLGKEYVESRTGRLHLTRPTDLFPTTHFAWCRRVDIPAGQVSLMLGRRAWRIAWKPCSEPCET